MGTFEEEQKKRVAAAKARGWDDATIQKFQLIDRIQQQRQQAQQPAPQQQATTTPENKPSLLKRFLVNTGAIAGQIGAGIGSVALAPATGGASLAGGFAAGAGIEALRRKLLGEKQNLGASVLEGGLTIVPGLLEGAKVLKGAKVGTEAVTAANTEKNALKETLMKAFKKPEEVGKITEFGTNVRGAQRGVIAGESIEGGAKKAIFNDASAAEMNAVIDKANKGVIPKGVRGQVRNVQAEAESVAQAQKAAAASSKAIVNKEAQTAIDDAVSKGRSKILKFDPTNESHIKINNAYAERLSNAKTPEQLLEQRRIFRDTAQSTFVNPTAEQTVEKELANVYYKATNAALDKIAPEVRTLDKQLSVLTKAEKTMTAKTSRLNPKGITPFGTSVNGQGFGGEAIQAAKEGVGKTIQTTGKIVQSPIVKTGTTQGVARSMTKPYVDASVVTNTPETTANEPSQDPVSALGLQFEQAGITDPQQMFDALNVTTDQQGEQAPTSGLTVSSQDLFNQALAEPDAKRRKELLDFSQVAAEFEKAAKPAKGKGYNSTAAAVIADTKTGLASLQDLATNITKSNVNNPVIGQIRTKNPWDTKAQKLQADVAVAKQIVGKALEGGVLRKEDEIKYAKILPSVGDSDATAQYKIQQLVSLISGRLKEYEDALGGGSGGLDITDFNQGATQ